MNKKYAVAGGVAAASAITAYTIWKKSRQWKPRDAQVITGFELEKYLGKWYEIARLDYRFEKNLDHTTAEYSMNKDGSVKVVNRGFNTKKKKWEEAEGVAQLREEENKAAFKVSFFGPFYSGYNVIGLDANYRFALVAGKDLDYLWLLSREKVMPEEIKSSFLNIATSIGYITDDLIWVNQAEK